MLVTAVNNDLFAFQTINIKYFETGHSFMSADVIHANVERQMKKQKNVYDFKDFVHCVSNSNCTAFEMKFDNFMNWQNGSSQQLKRQNGTHLADISTVEFRRGQRSMFFKKSLVDDNFSEFTFLKKGFNTSILPSCSSKDCGVNEKKKSDILQKLTPMMPMHKRAFWVSLNTANIE